MKAVNKKIIDSGMMLIIPLVILLAIEYILRGTLQDVLIWSGTNGFELIVNYMVLFSLVNIFVVFKRRIYLFFSIIFTLLFIILSKISQIKSDLRGEPLLPSDILLLNEGKDIIQYVESINFVSILIIVILLVMILIFIIKSKYIGTFSLSIITRSIIGFASLFVCLTLLFTPKMMEKIGVIDLVWDQEANYNQNGFIVGMLLNTDVIDYEEPDNYNEDTLTELVVNLKTETLSLGGDNQSSVKPNIIFIMSEAFWDPTRLEGITFSKDPLPFFHELENSFTHGDLYVPVFGGGTVNTEFEVLTGLSTKFLASGSIPYQEAIQAPLHSITNNLDELGYRNIAIHTYHNWFYKRNVVYKNLGFHQYISGEFFSDAERKGAYISDLEISNEIIKQIKENKNPTFIHAVTMQNHGPYSAPRTEDQDSMIVIDGDISEESKNSLSAYSQNLYESDSSLQKLVSGVGELNEPTIIVFFGDHLPMLGNDYQLYRETSFINDNENAYTKDEMYKVPFIVWDNYLNLKPKKIEIGSNFLGAYILDLINASDWFYDYINSIYKSTTSYFKKNEDVSEYNNYQLLQYDIMFGENYSKLNRNNENEDYHLGNINMVINETYPSVIEHGIRFNENNGKSTMTISGEGFSSVCSVFINDNLQKDVVFGNDGLLSVTIDDRFYRKSGEMSVQLKILDSKSLVIAESNKVTITIK